MQCVLEKESKLYKKTSTIMTWEWVRERGGYGSKFTGWKSKCGGGDGWAAVTAMPGSTWYMGCGGGMPGTVGEANLYNLLYLIISLFSE